MNEDTVVLGSVAKTGRCVIVHEAARTGGFGAEIAATVAERGLTSLLAPLTRVTGYDTVIPMGRLKQHYAPSIERIVTVAGKVCRFFDHRIVTGGKAARFLVALKSDIELMS